MQFLKENNNLLEENKYNIFLVSQIRQFQTAWTPFFIGRTYFVPQIRKYGIFFDQETYIHFVAQETRITRK
mgnify:CR=1 FL=1